MWAWLVVVDCWNYVCLETSHTVSLPRLQIVRDSSLVPILIFQLSIFKRADQWTMGETSRCRCRWSVLTMLKQCRDGVGMCLPGCYDIVYCDSPQHSYFLYSPPTLSSVSWTEDSSQASTMSEIYFHHLPCSCALNCKIVRGRGVAWCCRQYFVKCCC